MLLMPLSSIKEKLSELGYEPYISELISTTNFTNHPVVAQAKALTDRSASPFLQH